MTESFLVHDHSELDASLAATFDALAVGDVELSFNELDVFWARLAMHIRAENVHLFPSLLHAAETPGRSPEAPTLETVRSNIARLRDDHDFFMHELTAAMKDLRKLLRSELQNVSEVMTGVHSKLTEVSQRLESHNALEESEVYHWAATLLDESAQQSLSKNIQYELDSLPPRLRKTSFQKFT